MSANHLSFARSRLARRVLIRGPVLGVAAVVVLLAQVGAGAAPGRPVSAPSVGKSILHPVGRAQVTTMRATNSSPPAHAGAVPVRAMNPAALAVAKRRADAAAIHALPTLPSQAGSGPAARKPSAAIFNNLNQPGLSASDEGNGVTPPDTTGAIGPNFYVEFVNQFVGVFDRNTLARVAALDLASFVGAPSGLTTTDVQIQWDPQSSRWIYALIGFQTGNNYVLFGWTKTADPSSLPGGWCRYGVGTGSSLNDYPKLGHDANFITIGANVSSDTVPTYPFVTANIWAIPKPLAGDTSCSSPVSAWYFADATHLLHNADGSLAFTPVPANTADGSSPGYIVAAHDDTTAPQSKVMVWHFAPGPTLVADGDMTVGTFSVPPSVPQPGTTYLLDSLDGRLTQAVQLRDPSAGGVEAVWTQHTVAGASGRAVVRWDEFAPSTLTVLQEGEIGSATDHIFNGAISPSSAGNDAGVSYNRGSGSTLALIGAQTRGSSTPLGQMDAGEVVLGTSATFDQETLFQGNCTTNPCRWGDYSGASPDPSNAGVVWGSNQLVGPAFFGFAQWTTQNFAISTGPVAAPDFSLSVAPPSQTVVAGNGTSYAVSVTPAGGFSGQVTLSLDGLPSGANGTFTPNPATGSSTLAVTTATTTPTGTYPLTIRGVSGTLSHSAPATLVVNAAPDFSLSATPTSASVGGSVTSTTYSVRITPINGFNSPVMLSASGPLIGALGTFSPNPATASSTLTVSIMSNTPAGTYTLTLTGTSGSLSHSTTVTLVVNADFSISASPTSRTIRHGRSTTYTITITALNGFTGSVNLAVAGLPSGSSGGFSPNPAATSSVLTVNTGGGTTGSFTLTITGTGGGKTHTVTVTLVVN
jgi:hypothetical protein